jgi:hypothetical protein
VIGGDEVPNWFETFDELMPAGGALENNVKVIFD